ncbi:hypothetical protein [Frateuria terrea]|nr:hypothetical protein [Frateuria terrea]
MLAELDEVKWLRDAAAGIALEGHAGWGNACIFGAECIERLQSTLADMAKRLEAAERDAAVIREVVGNWRVLERVSGNSFERGAFKLCADQINAATQEGEG